MPAVARQRITSQTSNVVFAANESAAIAAVLGGAAGNTVAVSNPFPFWPKVQKYVNDNNPNFGGATNPAYVWSETPADPSESFGFAVKFNNILTIAEDAEFVFAVAVFGDNAHSMRISAYNTDSLQLIPTQTNLNFLLNDGDTTSFNPPENVTSPPFGWQNVRFYTINASIGVTVFVNVTFVVSFVGVNYATNGPENPAGLAFFADLYQCVVPAT
ncbi:hypothetical protein [Paenibacillus montanisoli]|uniref:Uncharacterized protein n=1 Tax=Paenibacillus montanisoli TaxID=2081970 RepID=A0A328TWD3_9BACL|nr:hypothetical protein [Paenibacillus montanisoli]RAP74808.1 hypothetical protein DL346_22485 [Paenibacillus montanisoli]